MKKYLALLLSVMMTLILLNGCGGKTTSLEGTYETSIVGIINQYTFSKNGTYVLKNSLGGESSGTYTIDGDKLTFIQDSTAIQYTFTLDNQTLILYEGGDTSSGVVYTKVDNPTDLSSVEAVSEAASEIAEEAETRKIEIEEAQSKEAQSKEAKKESESETETEGKEIFLNGTYEAIDGGTYRLTFDKDGNFTYTEATYLGENMLRGTYTIKGDKLTLIGDATALQYTITLMDDAIMLIKDGDSEGRVYTLVEGSENGKVAVVSPVGVYNALFYDYYIAPNGTSQMRQCAMVVADDNTYTFVAYQKDFSNNYNYVESEIGTWSLDDSGTVMTLNSNNGTKTVKYVAGNGVPYSIAFDNIVEVFYENPNSNTARGLLSLVSQVGGSTSINGTGNTDGTAGGIADTSSASTGGSGSLNGKGPFNVYSIDDMEGDDNTYYITCTVYIGDGNPDFDNMETYNGTLKLYKFGEVNWLNQNSEWETISVMDWMEMGGHRMIDIKFNDDGTIQTFSDGYFD